MSRLPRLSHQGPRRQVQADGARLDDFSQLEDVVEGHGTDVRLRPPVAADLHRLLELDPSEIRKSWYYRLNISAASEFLQLSKTGFKKISLTRLVDES